MLIIKKSRFNSLTFRIYFVYFFADTATGYAVGYNSSSGSCIIKTTDGGDHWATRFTSTNWIKLTCICFTDTETGIAAGSEYGQGVMLRTADGGMTWTSTHVPEVEIINSVAFADAATGYAAGVTLVPGWYYYVSAIMKTTDGGVTWAPCFSHSHCRLKIYPNPTSDRITILAPAPGVISIISPGGRTTITRPVSGPKTIMDVSGLKNGAYLVRLISAGTVYVAKFIKM